MVGLKVGEKVLLVRLLGLLLRLWDDDKVELLGEVFVVVLGFVLVLLDLVVVEIVSQLLKNLMLFDLTDQSRAHNSFIFWFLSLFAKEIIVCVIVVAFESSKRIVAEVFFVFHVDRFWCVL